MLCIGSYIQSYFSSNKEVPFHSPFEHGSDKILAAWSVLSRGLCAILGNVGASKLRTYSIHVI